MRTIRGIVEHGDARGRELGFPTANISVTALAVRDSSGSPTVVDESLLTGVWEAEVLDHTTGQRLTATVSVGRRPQFYGKTGVLLLEAYMLDFPSAGAPFSDGNLYGHDLEVELRTYIRGQRSFTSVEELVVCMQEDVALARESAGLAV